MATMTLYANVPLNNSYKNIIRFTSDAKAITFLNPYAIGSTTQMNIPPYGDKNEIITSVCVDTAIAHVTRSELMTINYCLLVDTQSLEVTGELPVPYMYYFVTDIKWLGGHSSDSGKALLTLELDVATTYKLCGKTGFTEEVFTERKHCSRFINIDEDSLYMFNDKEVLGGDVLDGRFTASIPTKQIYMEQVKNPLNAPNNISDSPMPLNRDEVISLIDKFEWELVVCRDAIKSSGKVPFYKTSNMPVPGNLRVQGEYKDCVGDDSTFLVEQSDKYYDSSIRVYIAPIYKNDTPDIINSYLYNNYIYVINAPTGSGTEENHASGVCPLMHVDYEKYGDIILSRFRLPINFLYQYLSKMFIKAVVDVPDFDLFPGQAVLEKQTITKTMIGIQFQESDIYYITGSPQSGASGEWELIVTKLGDPYKNPFDSGYVCSMSLSKCNYNDNVFTFNSESDIVDCFSELKGVDDLRDESLEPKLLIEPYSTYTLRSHLGTPQGFKFNPLLLETESASCIFKYVPNVSTAKFTLYLQPLTEFRGVDDECISPYKMLPKLNVGDINVTDYTLPIKSDPFFTMALNQRNYRTSGLVIPVAASLGQSLGILAGTSLVSGNIGASMPGTVTGLTAAATAAANYITHIDDLKNAPDSIKNSGNDALHDSALGLDLRPFIAVYTLKEIERKQVFDYYYRYGYMVNTYIDYTQWFNRQIFNYVKTRDDLVDKFTKYDDYVIPYFIRMKLESILNNGVTIWEQEQITKFLSTKYENAEYPSMIPNTRLD